MGRETEISTATLSAEHVPWRGSEQTDAQSINASLGLHLVVLGSFRTIFV